MEVYRVLKRSGVAYIGDGFSRLMPPEEIQELLREPGINQNKAMPNWDKLPSLETIKGMLFQAGIKSYSLSKTSGTWIEIRK